MWCWRRLLRVPWTTRRSNQSILKEINPEYSLEGLMLKLRLQYFGHLMWRVDSLEKTLMLERLKAGGEGDDRGWDGWMASPTWCMSLSKLQSWWCTGKPGMLQSMGSQRLDTTEQLNWTDDPQSPLIFMLHKWQLLLNLLSWVLHLCPVLFPWLSP